MISTPLNNPEPFCGTHCSLLIQPISLTTLVAKVSFLAMGSYRDVVRYGTHYTSDQFLHMYQQYANNISACQQYTTDSPGGLLGRDGPMQWRNMRSQTLDNNCQRTQAVGFTLYRGNPNHHTLPEKCSNFQGERRDRNLSTESQDQAFTEECSSLRQDQCVTDLPKPTTCNPFSNLSGESLPPHLVRNWAGLLVEPSKVLPISCIDSFTLSQVSNH